MTSVFFAVFRWIGTITGYPFNWIYFKKKVYYESGRNLKRRFRGGALVVSNHFSPMDYVSHVFLFFPRRLNVVAAEIGFANPFVRFGMRFWGGIQANRVTRSMRFVKQSAELIKKGQLVQIFPEGHNTDDGAIKAFYPSYIAIALESGAPILPVITDGNYGLFKRTHIIIGEEIRLSEYLSPDYAKDYRSKMAEIDRLNGIVRQKVLALREELDRRVAGKKPPKRKK